MERGLLHECGKPLFSLGMAQDNCGHIVENGCCFNAKVV